MHQERPVATHQQQNQYLVDLQRMQQQGHQQHSLQNIDIQIQQHQEIFRRYCANQLPPTRNQSVELIQRPLPPLSTRDRIGNFQILNLAGLSNPRHQFPPWMQSTARAGLPLRVQDNMGIVNQQRPQIVDLSSPLDATIRPNYPQIQQSRSAVNLQTSPGIRIINVGSLQGNTSFPTVPRGYAPSRN